MTPAPAIPDRADRSTFVIRSLAQDDWRKNFHVPEMVAALVNVYSNAVSAFNDAVSAAASAITATTQATNAAASAVSASGSALTAINAPGTSATSITSATIGTGSKSLTIQTGKSLVPGMWIVAANTAAPSANQMTGSIDSYNSGTGALVFTVPAGAYKGSGTFTAWTVSLTSMPGTNDMPILQNSQSAAYTFALTDTGKHILHPSADTTARIFTIPANSSVAFPIGSPITIVNQASAGTLTIAITSDTMTMMGSGATGSRTLPANNIATLLKVTSTAWVITGSSGLA